MQIMLMTQLLKDTEETADGEPEEGAKNIYHIWNYRYIRPSQNFYDEKKIPNSKISGIH